jgi:hypothetical protein
MPDPMEEIYKYIKEVNQIITQKGCIELIDLMDSLLEYILF